MHVHDLNPKRTVIAMVIFVFVIVVGLLTLTNPRLKYSVEPPQAISIATDFSSGVNAKEIDNLLSASTSPTILIDIRNHYEFARGHIASAINISAVELLSKENIKWLNELKEDQATVIIYGDSHLQANGPWMVLQQLGFDNVTYLSGGYSNYLNFKEVKSKNNEFATYEADKAKYNFAEIAKETVGTDVTNTSKKKHTVVKRKKKGKATAGGC